MSSTQPIVIAPIAPKLVSISSSNSTTITLHFDRAVTAGSGNFVISDGHSQSYVGASGLTSRIVGATDTRTLAAGDSQISYEGQNIVIHLSSALQSGASYSVTMGAGAVNDLDTNGAIGRISSTALFSFTASGSASAPSTPSAAVDAAIHFVDTGASASDYFTTALDQTVNGTYSGTLGTNEFIQVSLDNGASWHQASVDADTHSWSYSGAINTGNLTTGANAYLSGAMLARVSNTDGSSSATASQAYVYSSHQIEIEVNPTVSFSTDSGVANDLITNTAAQTVSGIYQGTLLSGQTLQISVDGGATWLNATAGNGSWQANSVTLLEGKHELQMRVTDAAGNASSTAYNEYTLISSGAGLAGRTLTLAAGSDSGVSASDGITNAVSGVTLNVAGLHGLHLGDVFQIVDTSNNSAVVGSYTIQYSDLYYGSSDYLALGEHNSAARTTLNISVSSALGDGLHALAVRLVDVAGNIGAASALSNATLNTSAPIVSSSAPVENASSVDGSLTTLTFTFSENIVIAAGTQITISDDSNPNNLQVVTLSADDVNGKTLTVHLASALTAGTHYTVKGAAVADLAGNVGITGDSPMLHFTTAGTYNTTPPPGALSLSVTDTAPASDSNASSSWHTDGVTNNNHLAVSGIASGALWYYRTSASGDWIAGGDGGIVLADGSYGMDQIQVKQTVNNVDSAVTSLHQVLVVDTQASSATVSGSHAFTYGGNSVSGTLSGSTDLPHEIVEVTLDNGVTWLQATTTYVNADSVTWSLSGISAQLGTSYGLRLSDQAGNITPVHASTNPVYYLSNSDNGFSHGDQNGLTVYGGNGTDVITVGDNAFVDGGSGGGGDSITTGSNAYIVAANNATIVTGNGNNVITVGFGASVSTGSGDDTIYASVIDNATIHAGAGADTLHVNVTSTLVLADLAVTGVETLDLNGGANDLTIATAASVRSFSDAGALTITAQGSSSVLHLNGSVWIADEVAAGATYQHYHTQTGEVLQIAQNITVDTHAPVVTSPQDNATDVATDQSQLVLTFDENITIADGTVITVRDDNNSDQTQQITLSRSAASGNTLSIDLAHALASGDHYTVTGVVSDAAGNATASDSALWQFTTTVPYSPPPAPTLTSVFISDDNGVSSDDQITNVAPQTLNGSYLGDFNGVYDIQIQVYAGTSASGTFLGTLQPTINPDTHTWSVDATQLLTAGTDTVVNYYVEASVPGSADSPLTQHITIDTAAPLAQIVPSATSFPYTGAQQTITGQYSSATGLLDEVVQVSLDNGASWQTATTANVSAGISSWSVTGTSSSGLIEVKIGDVAGNLANYSDSGRNIIVLTADAAITFDTSSGSVPIFTGSANDTFNLSEPTHNILSGGGGTDTVTLRFSGETLSLAKLFGIEVINMSPTYQQTTYGSNTISGITPTNVTAMTDLISGGHKLQIDGNSTDNVYLGTGWSQANPSENPGYYTYHATSDSTTVLLIGSAISVHTSA